MSCPTLQWGCTSEPPHRLWSPEAVSSRTMVGAHCHSTCYLDSSPCHPTVCCWCTLPLLGCSTLQCRNSSGLSRSYTRPLAHWTCSSHIYNNKHHHFRTMVVWGVCTDVSWAGVTAWQQWVADSEVYHWLHWWCAAINGSLELLEAQEGLLGDKERTLSSLECLGPQTLGIWTLCV